MTKQEFTEKWVKFLEGFRIFDPQRATPHEINEFKNDVDFLFKENDSNPFDEKNRDTPPI